MENNEQFAKRIVTFHVKWKYKNQISARVNTKIIELSKNTLKICTQTILIIIPVRTILREIYKTLKILYEKLFENILLKYDHKMT